MLRSPRSEDGRELGRDESPRDVLLEPLRRSDDLPSVLLPEYELRSDESRPLAVRPPVDAPSRYEPDGRDEPGREPPEDGRPDALAPREPPDEGRPLDGLPEDDLDDEERELPPPRLLGREPELLAGDISVPDFFSSSALFSCFVQQLDCCWCFL